MHETETGYAVEPEHSDPEFWMTFVVGTVGAVLLVVVVLFLEALYHRTIDAEYQRKVVLEQPEALRLMRAEQLDQLNGYRTDANGNVTGIPIERAMELVVEQARKTGGRVDAP